MSKGRAARRIINARAYAKVNLCLAVAPPEPPGSPRAGWHRIASWFAPVELWDDVRVERPDAGATRGGGMATALRGYADGPGGDASACAGPRRSDAEPSPCHPSQYLRRWADDAPRPSPIDWLEEKDLAVRAHRLLETHVGSLLPVRLELTKRTPTGSGLGGGSSDAAAVLRAVASLFRLRLSMPALRSLAAGLGSDVAYFVPDEQGRAEGDDAALLAPPAPGLVRGFGNDIQPAAPVRGPLTLILPEFGCPTPAVYRAFDALPPRAFRDDDAARLASPGCAAPGELTALSGDLFNDLTEAAIVVEPRLRGVIEALRAAGHDPHLSGSGSTVFVLGDARVLPPPGCVAVRTRFAGPAGAKTPDSSEPGA